MKYSQTSKELLHERVKEIDKELKELKFDLQSHSSAILRLKKQISLLEDEKKEYKSDERY